LAIVKIREEVIMEITKEQFMRYEAVRQSGVTNMWDTRRVARLARLARVTVLEIIKHYPELKAKYLEKGSDN